MILLSRFVIDPFYFWADDTMKRMKILSAIMGMAVMVNGGIVFAGANNGHVYFSTWSAEATQFVSFTEGPLTISDKVSYTFTLFGDQKDKASLQYRAGTPSKMVAEGTLSKIYGYQVSGTEVSAGYGNSYAYAEMDIEGSTYRIQAN